VVAKKHGSKKDKSNERDWKINFGGNDKYEQALWNALWRPQGKWDSSSSSSEEYSGRPHHHGHGHGHHGSHSKEQPWPQPQPQPKPQPQPQPQPQQPQPTGQCVDLASSALDVVKVMCPKSCGLCTPHQRMHKPTEEALVELVASWGNNVCRAINPLSKPIRN